MTMLKVVQYGLGISLVLLGIAGLFLPFLQGILLILLGVAVIKADDIRSIAKLRLKR